VKKLRIISQDHSITQESLGNLRDLISGTKDDLEDQLDAVRQTISAADASLREVLSEDQARLQSSLESIARVQRIADTTQPKVIIEDNRAGEGSRAIFGTDTSQPGFSLTVARNEAGVGAVYSAGVHSPQTLHALLQHSRTPDLALALQALQTQSTSVRNEAVQSVLNDISAERSQGVPHAPAISLMTESNSLDSISRGQPVGSIGSMPANVEKHGNRLDRSSK
jgi:ABC-type transporter Mla subunit MlaD